MEVVLMELEVLVLVGLEGERGAYGIQLPISRLLQMKMRMGEYRYRVFITEMQRIEG